jgi:hypothetical protein
MPVLLFPKEGCPPSSPRFFLAVNTQCELQDHIQGTWMHYNIELYILTGWIGLAVQQLLSLERSPKQVLTRTWSWASCHLLPVAFVSLRAWGRLLFGHSAHSISSLFLGLCLPVPSWCSFCWLLCRWPHPSLVC